MKDLRDLILRAAREIESIGELAAASANYRARIDENVIKIAAHEHEYERIVEELERHFVRE